MSQTLVRAPDIPPADEVEVDLALSAGLSAASERSVAEELSEIFAAGFASVEPSTLATPQIKPRVFAPWSAGTSATGRLAIAAALAAGVLGLGVGALLAKSGAFHTSLAAEATPSFAALAYTGDPSLEAPAGAPASSEEAVGSSAAPTTIRSHVSHPTLQPIAKHLPIPIPGPVPRPEVNAPAANVAAVVPPSALNGGAPQAPIGGGALEALAKPAYAAAYPRGFQAEAPAAFQSEPAQPSPRAGYYAAEPGFRPRAQGAYDGCEVDRPCSAYMAVMQADQKLRRAYADAIHAGAPRSVVLRVRADWADLRSEAAGRPDELVRGYDALRQMLSRARDETRARQGYGYGPYAAAPWVYQR